MSWTHGSLLLSFHSPYLGGQVRCTVCLESLYPLIPSPHPLNPPPSQPPTLSTSHPLNPPPSQPPTLSSSPHRPKTWKCFIRALSWRRATTSSSSGLHAWSSLARNLWDNCPSLRCTHRGLDKFILCTFMKLKDDYRVTYVAKI